MGGGPGDPKPNLETLTTSDMLLEMGEIIQGSRKYFAAVCTGIGDQAEGDLAYEYFFVASQERAGRLRDRRAPDEINISIVNDEYHEIWIPVEGDLIPSSWVFYIGFPYADTPIKDVHRKLSPQAEFIKNRLEKARSNADGIANMQAKDFDAIAVIPTALGMQNIQLDYLITTLSEAGGAAQGLREQIEDVWVSDAKGKYVGRVGVFKDAVEKLSAASVKMKNANIELARSIGELMYAIMELWKARIEGLDEKASGILGGAKDLVSLLTKPTLMSVLQRVVDVVWNVIKKMATQDVSDRMKKLQDLGDMMDKSRFLEEATAAAGQVHWPTIPGLVFE